MSRRKSRQATHRRVATVMDQDHDDVLKMQTTGLLSNYQNGNQSINLMDDQSIGFSEYRKVAEPVIVKDTVKEVLQETNKRLQ